MNTNLRLCLVILVTVLMAGAGWLARRHNTGITARAREMETGVPSFDRRELKRCVEQARRDWEAANQAVTARDLPAASRAYADVYYSGIKSIAEHHGQQEAEPGVPVASWQASKETAYRALVLKELPAWFDAVAVGDLTVNGLRDFLGTAGQFGFKEPQQQFNETESRLQTARAKAASRWLRVDIVSDHPDYAAQVSQALRAKWQDRHGFKLTFGSSMGPLEDQATWKTLRIRVAQEIAQYQVLNKRFWGRVQPPAIPRGVRVTFLADGTPEVTNSWSRLAALAATVTVPERLSINEQDERNRQSLLDLELEKRKELLAQMELQLARLPSFELFPGVNPATLSLRQNDRLDLNAARALGYLDKPRLIAQVQALTGDPKLQPELAALVVGVELDPFAAWLTKTIPQLPPQARRGVAQELKRKPWFGDHEPILALARAESRQPSYIDLDYLRGQLHVAKVRETVVAQASQPTPVRQNFASLFIAEAPIEDARMQVTSWLADTNVDFVRAVLMQLGNRDRHVASRVAVDGFQRAPDALKPALFDQIARRGTRPDAEAFALARLALSSRHEPLRTSVTRFLIDQSHEPAGWELLEETARAEPPGRRADEWRLRLALNVRRAQPDKAQAYLLELVRAQTNYLRETAILELMSQDHPKPEMFLDLARATEERPQDVVLRRTIIRAIHQSHRVRHGWTFGQEQTGLTALLLSGLRDTDPVTRRKSEEVVLHAVEKKGAKHLAPYVAAATPTSGATPVQAREPGR